MTIPAGADACQDVGAYGDPQPLHLSNDGTLVAFNARDFAHETSLWLGDLRDGSIKVAYVAPETTGNKVDIWWPQLAAGQLFWIEYVHSGPDASTPTTAWTVKRMSVSTGAVSVVAKDRMPDFGGKKYVESIRWDGRTLAVTEALLGDKWQIELWDEAGHVQQTIPVSGVPYDLALIANGVIYTSGIPYPENDSIGQMRLFRWTADAGSKQIGTGAFSVAGCSDLAAWVSDPEASRDSTGFPVSQRVFVARAPFEESMPMSPAPKEGDPGIDAVVCESGTVVWWEVEGGRAIGRDVLTVWQPGWSAPLQVETDGDGVDLSAHNGWIVWFEYDADNNGRLRGLPTSVLTTAHP